jgi:hypothetical protein
MSTTLTLDQEDELNRLRRRIVLRSALIDFTFLQGDDDLKLTDHFAGDFTVAEAILELVDDIRDAADNIGQIIDRAKDDPEVSVANESVGA